ncbi:hypothetical protein PSI9734_01865 [Pseudidiomarina piscicola]|uniref:Ubiquinone biosynthesis accessory factor UbiT n=1 Tax=Pseudidiomarina piscicola TaxID=2614830 RepID=A0A6S6WL42_9GAMM|nr:SCP2 sterol-binding domain-containing protein [Pseudidiomarina piscicola]CAB0151478.1 hypothetical protein PSI9734_01865 [Pseudidiomarina piscicola]VZT40957.1 hypothetical protein PSI9734_01865 [Pseudomonas aeruginosa]
MVITKVVEFAPRLLQATLTRAPASFTTAVIERLFNQVFKADLDQGSFDFLTDRWAAIEVRDLALKFTVSVQQQQQKTRFNIASSVAAPDVSMRVDWPALLQLSTQQVDPDTLFFRRKLLLTGDTELGLQIKNLLDTIELQERLPGPCYRLLSEFSNQTNRVKALT